MTKTSFVPMVDRTLWDAVLAKIRNAHAITIITHTKPDADAYGSSLGLYFVLKEMGYDAVVVNESPTHAKYGFIPGTSKVVAKIPQSTDLLIVLDCGDEKRVGDSLKDAVVGFNNKICIDHHLSNDGFGNPSIVKVDASSTSELIFDFARYAEELSGKTFITLDGGKCLFSGLYGDTGGFRYASTTIASFEMAAELARRGIHPTPIVEAYLGSRSWSQVRIQSEALLQATPLCGGKVVEIVVPNQLVQKHGGDWIDTEGLVEQARDIHGAQVGVFIGEEGAVTKVGLRSRSTSIAVNTIAEEFGGGGHKNAAAFRSKLPLAEVQAQLRKRLEELLSA